MLCGAMIGFLCGFIGAGGGMILMILTGVVLGAVIMGFRFFNCHPSEKEKLFSRKAAGSVVG